MEKYLDINEIIPLIDVPYSEITKIIYRHPEYIEFKRIGIYYKISERFICVLKNIYDLYRCDLSKDYVDKILDNCLKKKENIFNELPNGIGISKYKEWFTIHPYDFESISWLQKKVKK